MHYFVSCKRNAISYGTVVFEVKECYALAYALFDRFQDVSVVHVYEVDEGNVHNHIIDVFRPIITNRLFH